MRTNERFIALRLAGQRIRLLVLVLSAAASAAALGQSASLSSSVQTVDELLRQENTQLLERRTGSTTSSGTAKPRPRKLDLQVRAIYGVGRLQADLLVNGHIIEGVPAGATIDQCKVTAIQNRCVSMEPALQKAKSQDDADAAKNGGGICPTRTCWAAMDQQPVAVIATPTGTGQMPAGAPGPAPAAASQR